MEWFSPEFWSALAAIIVIDLVLAGDNAIVIALAARNLPQHLQRKAIFWGTFGAIAVRVAMTMIVVWLLKIPGLMLIGGLALIWIALKLLAPGQNGEAEHGAPAAATFLGAMKTIVVADAVMGLDNVVAVAGAAHGSFALVVIGLLISIPIVIWGSQLILQWIERFPAIVYVGVAVLAWTSAKMIIGEPLLDDFVDTHPGISYAIQFGVVAGVLGIGAYINRRRLAASHTANAADVRA
jgi:YjbE family integral membrane protein